MDRDESEGKEEKEGKKKGGISEKRKGKEKVAGENENEKMKVNGGEKRVYGDVRMKERVRGGGGGGGGGGEGRRRKLSLHGNLDPHVIERYSSTSTSDDDDDDEEGEGMDFNEWESGDEQQVSHHDDNEEIVRGEDERERAAFALTREDLDTEGGLITSFDSSDSSTSLPRSSPRGRRGTPASKSRAVLRH